MERWVRDEGWRMLRMKGGRRKVRSNHGRGGRQRRDLAVERGAGGEEKGEGQERQKKKDRGEEQQQRGQ